MGGTNGAVGKRGMERAPYPRRLLPDEIAEICELFVGGATAKALAARFGGSERRIFNHLGEHGCLRKQQAAGVCALGPEEVGDVVRATRGCEADALCRALGADASLGDAARAAAGTAIAMLREAQPARSYTYARLAGALERLARGTAMEGGDGDGTERGRLAALDALRELGAR